MTDDDPRTGAGPDREPVGSVTEEAARLLAALSGLAKDQGHEYAGAAAGAASAAGEAIHNVNDHLATGAPECSYCPICQVIHVVRGTSPEVKAHLLSAANSLVQAAAGALSTQVPTDRATAPVQKIDLDEES